MRMLHCRIRPAWLATTLLLVTVSTAGAVPIYIAPFTVGSFMWKDLDGKCVASCPHQYLCPCFPKTYGNFWIPG